MKATFLALSGFLLLAAPPAVQAQFYYSTNADGSIYTCSPNAGGSVTIDAYSGPPWAVSIPASINGLPVTGIAAQAFTYSTNLGSVTIPNGVINIGYEAFLGCTNLGSVTIPGSITNWGDYAFSYCFSLTNATMGNGVTSIGREAFEQCFNLTSVTIPGSVTSIGYGAFVNCFGLTSVCFQGNAPTVASEAFYGENPTAYYLPGTIGWSVFSTNTGLQTAVWWLPNPVILTCGPSFGVQNNRFGFIISWATNISVVVEACANLASPVWTPLTNVTLTSGSVYFSDPQWTNYPGRYYGLGFP